MVWKRCRKRKPEPKPGEILDQVISQSSSSANKCLLYKLADYKRGGDLIDAFQMGGQIAVETLIREQFGVFMYNIGKGQVINRAEYLRWKYMDNQEVRIPIEASLSSHDPLGKWVDHKACWQMQYRGSLGESLLHVLIICDTKTHTKLARILLRVFPVLSLDVIEGEEYLGASALHLAIAYSNNELVQDLIEAGANVNQRAIGSFFLPRDQQVRKAAKNTDYEGLAYLGEYPLAWAACCANESVYNLLLECGADPDAQDSFGNMILHMVVVCDKLDMFGYALRHPKLPAKNGIINHAGLTPLTLACKLGRAEVFREMLELSSREFWRYSNITCSGYPLNALDTLLPDGRTNWNSALFIILNGTKEEHLDMLDGGIIQRLLEEKWKTFARKQFLKRLLILFIHLLFLSVSVYLRPTTDNHAALLAQKEANEATNNLNELPELNEHETDTRRIIRYCSEIATIIGVLSYVIFQQGDEVKNQGLGAFLKQLTHAPAKAIFLVSNLMILACIPFRLMGDMDTEEAILVFAVPGSWFLLMFFAGAVRLTGPFVTMIYSMITGDMFTFGIIYSIIIFGFSQAFYFLYKGHPQVKNTLFESYASTWMALFQTTLGDYSYSDLNSTLYPNLGKTVFVMFMIFVPILLLNMLIAMMGNTYAHVIEQSEKEWMKQWAKIVVTLERAVSQSDAKKYLEDYSISLGPSDDSGYEQRGVMVIKTKSKTRAKQRKGAVSNWKRVGKVTLTALKKRGMTGEELRRLMWGRASISSPTKITKKKPTGDPFTVDCGAITAALDVMSYTHDIVMINDKPTQQSTIHGQTNTNNITTTTVLNDQHLPGQHLDVLNPQHLEVHNLQHAPLTHNQQTLNQQHNINYKDPLRELVLISEVICVNDNNYMSEVKNLAKEATILEHCKEVSSGNLLIRATSAQHTPRPHHHSQLPHQQPIVDNKNLTAQQLLFQNPKDIVDPEKEKAFLKQIEALDDTDSCDEKPVLGKISLIRRAKSAVLRTSSAKGKKTDQHPLFLIAWDEDKAKIVPTISGSGNGTITGLITTPTTSALPINNDLIINDNNLYKLNDIDELTTINDVKRQMELFHQKNVSHKHHRHQQNNSSDSSDQSTKSNEKLIKKNNTKMRRVGRNRISPSDNHTTNGKDTVLDGGNTVDRRGKSAQELRTISFVSSQHVKEEEIIRSVSPPDPLEPWSTKELANINKILGTE